MCSARDAVISSLRTDTCLPVEKWSSPHAVFAGINVSVLSKFDTPAVTVYPHTGNIPVSPPSPFKNCFADGAFNRKLGAMSAAFWDESMSKPMSFSVRGPKSSTEPELQGALGAIRANRNTQHINLFLDSKSAINGICSTHHLDTQLNKFKNRVTLREIRHELSNRDIIPYGTLVNPTKRSISLCHVYSHTKVGSRKRRKLEEKYGKHTEYIVKGNHAVDVSASTSNKLSSPPHVPVNHRAGDYTIYKSNGKVISIGDFISEHTNTLEQLLWMGTDHTKANRFLDKSVDLESSLRVAQEIRCVNKRLSNFSIRCMLFLLPTKSTKRRKINYPLQEAYSSPTCVMCGLADESHIHLFSECVSFLPSLNLVADNSIKFINELCGTNYVAFPWWFPTDRPRWAHEDAPWAQGFDQALGAIGFIPSQLLPFLSTRMTAKQALLCVDFISASIATRNLDCWLSRCDKLFKNKNAHKPPKTPNFTHKKRPPKKRRINVD
jgi:ribonuclease HI